MKEVIRAIEKNSDRLDQIRKVLGKEELLAGLAEEAGEVVQALREVAVGEASDESGASVKLASKLRALELLGKHLGLFEGLGARVLPKVEIREDIING